MSFLGWFLVIGVINTHFSQSLLQTFLLIFDIQIPASAIALFPKRAILAPLLQIVIDHHPPRVRSGKRRFLNYFAREVSRLQIKNDDNIGRQKFKFGRLPDLTPMIFSGGGEEWGGDN